MAYNREPTSIPTTQSFSPKPLIKALVLALLILYTFFYIIRLQKEISSLESRNATLSNELIGLREKNSNIQIDAKMIRINFEQCLEKSKKTEKKLKKTKYFYHMLKLESRKLIDQLRKKMGSFQIKGGDCNLLSFIQNSYEKFKDFFVSFYENNKN